MRPMRRSFRPMMPAIGSMAAKLAVALVVVSVVGALLTKAGHGDWLPLIPAEVLMGLHPWQPLTYVFLGSSALDVIFGALILWSLGGALEMRWGPRRLGLFAVGVTVLSGLVTVLIARWATSLLLLPYSGGWVMSSVLWVAYGLSFGKSQTNFWGIPLSGNAFALIGVGFTALSALFGAWQMAVPEAVGFAFTFGYMRGLTPRVAWLRLQNWRLQRKLKGRAKHLRLVAKDRNTPTDSDHYLH